jgi:acetate---CoA ligase (ADP-forming)
MPQQPRPPLEQLFRPRSIVLLGGSDRNMFSQLMYGNIKGLGFAGRVYAMNKRGVPAHGFPGVTSCKDIGESVDAGIVLVPSEAVMEVVVDAVEAGIRNLVVISSGFDEVGPEGRARQQELLEYSTKHNVNVLGPNCLGYQNHVDRVALGAIPHVVQRAQPALAIVSASGSVAMYMAQTAIQQGLGLTHMFATGNEMSVTTADVVDTLIDDQRVQAFILFMESIRDPEQFARVAERARQANKPIVALKVGAAEATAAVAAAHTGALVGDDRVFDAVCDRYGVVRAGSFEECVAVAGTIMTIGPVRKRGVGIISISGGNCEILSDLCAQRDVPVPQFAPETKSALREVITSLGQTHNPIDLTGQATREVSLWTSVPRAIAKDPGIGLTIINMELPANATPYMPDSLDHIGKVVHSCETPVLLMSNTATAVNEYGHEFLTKYNIAFAAPGLDLGTRAVSKLLWWSERALRDSRHDGDRSLARKTAAENRPTSERAVLNHLARFDVPVISSTLVRSAEEAVTAARRLRCPVVLKIASEDIPHKTDIGGVKLNLVNETDVSAAYNDIVAAAKQAQPQARLDGVSVSPFRRGGVEILVGIARDPQWGLVMALGLGGVWVEAFQDTALRLLPVTQDDLVHALEGLRAAKLFKGFRGAPPVNLRAVAQAAVRIGDAALALGPELRALEVNPLFAAGDQVEALDALAVWSSPPQSH